MPEKMKGIYAALLTPFVGEEISTEKFKDNIRHYNETDLDGYVVLGSTGECVSISDDESERLVRTARDTAAKGKKVIAGTGRESTKLTIEFTDRMANLGIDAALIRPPSYFKSKMTKDALKTHFLTVAEKSHVPVIVYNIPQNTGISLEANLIVELAKHPQIIGLKESSGTIAFLGEIIRQLPPDFSFLVGHGSVFLPALLIGASGAILAVANAAPRICARIYRLFTEGKIKEAAELQLDLLPLNRAVMETYGISGLKYTLDIQGWYGGPARPPLVPLETQGKAELKELLQRLGLVG